MLKGGLSPSIIRIKLIGYSYSFTENACVRIAMHAGHGKFMRVRECGPRPSATSGGRRRWHPNGGPDSDLDERNPDSRRKRDWQQEPETVRLHDASQGRKRLAS